MNLMLDMFDKLTTKHSSQNSLNSINVQAKHFKHIPKFTCAINNENVAISENGQITNTYYISYCFIPLPMLFYCRNVMKPLDFKLENKMWDLKLIQKWNERNATCGATKTNWRTFLIRSIFVQHNIIKYTKAARCMLVGTTPIRWDCIQISTNNEPEHQVQKCTYEIFDSIIKYPGVIITIIVIGTVDYLWMCENERKANKNCDKLHVICQTRCIYTQTHANKMCCGR